MARRRRGRHSFKIPVISAAILAGQIGFALSRSSDWKQAVDVFQSEYTGFNFGQGQFIPQTLLVGYGPWLAKGLIMKVARPLGAAPRLPVRGLPISLS